jgi:hypothetical protein
MIFLDLLPLAVWGEPAHLARKAIGELKPMVLIRSFKKLKFIIIKK